MSAYEQIKDMMEMIGIKALLESMTKPIIDLLNTQLAEIGIEADIKFDIEVKSINLDTFREKGGCNEKDKNRLVRLHGQPCCRV